MDADFVVEYRLSCRSLSSSRIHRARFLLHRKRSHPLSNFCVARFWFVRSLALKFGLFLVMGEGSVVFPCGEPINNFQVIEMTLMMASLWFSISFYPMRRDHPDDLSDGGLRPIWQPGKVIAINEHTTWVKLFMQHHITR